MKGIYQAAQGMVYESMRIDVLSNNLANLDSNGYKKSELQVTSTFDAELNNLLRTKIPVKSQSTPIGEPKIMVANYNINFQQGDLKKTDGKFDVAIHGDGFFGVQNSDGSTVFTRDGGFTSSSDGTLVNKTGLPILDRNENPIRLPIGAVKIHVSEDGKIFADGTEIAELMVVDFDEPRPLKKIGANLFELKDRNISPEPATDFKVKHGFVETSNLNSVHEMVKMIETLRNFQGYQKTIQTLDEASQKINSVASS